MIKDIKTNWETVFMPLWFLLCRYRFNFWSRKKIKKYQSQRMKKLIRFAVENTNFYREYYRGFNLDDVKQLPVVNKKIIMDNLSDVNSLGLDKKEILQFCLAVEATRDFSRRYKGLNIGMSSGTSGNKGIEITTPREENYLKTCLLARFPFLPGEKLNLAFILRVFTPAFNFNKFGHHLTYVDQMQSWEKIIEQLNFINPNVISGPSSVLRMLAKKLRTGELKVKPKRLISYAEVLTPKDSEFINKIFKAEVHQIYKATEGSIAITCRAGSLHINEDLVAVELLEKDGTTTLDGQPCRRMIVTDLHKTSMPIIRYALNDIITVRTEKCSCGSSFRVISQIQGRGDDILWARNQKDNSWRSIFPDYLSRAIISANDNITDYQAIQYSEKNLELRIQPKLTEEEKKYLIHSIEQVFLNFDCCPPHVIIKWEPPLPNKWSGKLIRIHRSFPEPE